MTRQKKEILRKINEIEEFIAVDDYLGCGFAPANFYQPLYEQIDELRQKLAKLCHFDDYQDYWNHECEMYINARMDHYNDDLPFA